MNHNEALDFLHRATTLGADEIAHYTDPDDIPTDVLVAAARSTMRVRELNSAAGGIVLGLLSARMSLREVQKCTDIPKSTVQTWVVPPPHATQGEPT